MDSLPNRAEVADGVFRAAGDDDLYRKQIAYLSNPRNSIGKN